MTDDAVDAVTVSEFIYSHVTAFLFIAKYYIQSARYAYAVCVYYLISYIFN